MAYRIIPEHIAKTKINSLDGRNIEITYDDCTVCPRCDTVPPCWDLSGIDGQNYRCSECGYEIGQLKSTKRSREMKNRKK